ncbi:MAG: cytochrome c oxidase accessory protein CcoG, partial [Gammaproteobacteria bacterium]|nr:cytochrome c oxidase accessory protein CcoG [Gammaproteobacteria bacterium]
MNAVPPAAQESHASDDNPPNVEAISLYKRREKIFVHYVGGKFQKLRLYTGWPLLLGYFLLPWVPWGERQAVLFDLPGRQFYIFGITFWPQDFMLLAWLLIIAAFALFAITSMVGRLWCGYTCPQTVWTAVFMWIEKRTEGSRNQRMRLDKQPMSLNKFSRRGIKHLLWIGFALLTGITFVGYFYPIRSLLPDVLTVNAGFWPMAWVVFFTLATYINAGWLREQVCIYMCPYARFQSAMIDKDTLVVAYDGRRGEPRGSRKRGPKPVEIGDCINCTLCVQVCPTGIDIRDGLQYECIQCANCIDACDQVMDKMGYAKGLIRYASERSLKEGPAAKPHFFRARTLGYIGAISVMIGLFAFVLATRIPFAIDVLRERGELFHIVDDSIRNDYTLKVVNKSQIPMSFNLSVLDTGPGSGSSATLKLSIDPRIEVPAGDVLTMPLSLTSLRADIDRNITNIKLRLCEFAGERCVEGETRFIAPPAGATSSRDKTTEEIPNQSRVGAPLTTSPNVRKI